MPQNQVRRDCVVGVHFEMFDLGGELLDSTREGDPIVYLHGANHFIPGLEEALEGRSVGDRFQITLPPERAFGLRVGEGPRSFPRKAFPKTQPLEPGMEFMLDDGDGEPIMVWVTSIDNERVEVDVNHPLAGETLSFDVEVTGIRPASPQELEHGHAHGAHGHDHS
jgi:FKBP-type peptidyl-prolyl cis-trans isomerase SlyD